MGIPKYHKWLTERYPDAFAEARQEKADHVYVDINALLHDCMRHAASEDGFYEHLFAKLDALFRTVVPCKSVFLAVDGPASCAKCLTQRQRRRAHAQKDAKSSKGRKGKSKGTSALSNNMLTPGVPFMTRLTGALEYFAASRMAPNGCFAKCRAVTVSGAQAIGEGEHKIVSQMLRNASEGAAADSHVISSGDADIFLLSLVQNVCRRVRVVSERPDEGHGKRRRGMTLQVWNAEALAGYIHRELTSRAPSARLSRGEAALRRDFALVSLLAGNDYLPELKGSVGAQKLWEQYLSLRSKQFPSTSLLQSSLTEGLPLSHQEGGWALEVGETGAAFAMEPYEHFSFHVPFLCRFMAAAAGGLQAVRHGAQAPDLTGRAAEGVRKYLEGLLWIMEMYHHGYCGDFFFVMEKSLHCFAHARVIADFLQSLPDDAEPLAPPRSEHQPMRPISCAMCILPVQNAEQYLCPAAPALRPMFKVEHPLLGSVNAIERSVDLQDCKKKLASLQQELMSLRAQGRDDSKVKAQLTAEGRRMEELKKGGSDIDVVPLWEVDAEVAERCSSKPLPELDFRPDATLLRGTGEPFSVQAPARGMRPASCKGLVYLTGEWPRADGELPVELDEELGVELEQGHALETGRTVEVGEEGWDSFADSPSQMERAEKPRLVLKLNRSAVADKLDEEPAAQDEELAAEDAELVAEEFVPDGGTFEVGDAVEGYWPDDAEYLPATIIQVYEDGSFQIEWDQDGSQSDVPADFVRYVGEEAVELDLPPAPKRARWSVL